MAFATKIILAFLAFPLFAQFDQLDDLWKQNKWKEWIATASVAGIKSPEAYFNLASASWEAEDSAEAVKNLFISSQLRNNPFKAWSDLSSISQIQSILFAQPSPIDSYRIRLFLIWDKHLQTIWFSSLIWIFLLGVFFRWGRSSSAYWNRVIIIIFALDLGAGSLFFLNQKGLSNPSYLTRVEKLVPVYKEFDSKTDEPLLELPSGVVILTGEKKANRILIQEPLKAWVDQNQVEPYPALN